MITNLDFVEHVAKEQKHTFVSTGMTSLEDIDKAIDIFKNMIVP